MSRARLTRAAARSLAAAAVLVALCAGTVTAGSIKAGDQLPEFDLVDLAGMPVTSADLQGAPAVVELWASWCLPCRETLRRVDALARTYAADGLRVVAVSIDQSHETAARFAQEQLGATPALRVLRDPDQSLMSRLGVAGLPAVYVIDEAGIVRFVTTGGKGDYLTDLDRAVTTLVKEE